MQSANKKFEELRNNDFISKIMTTVCRRYLKNVCTEDEMESLRMATLWKCVNNYKEPKDPTGKAKFTSYLYRSIKNNAKRLKKQKIKKECLIDNFNAYTYYNEATLEVRDILESVKTINEEMYNILVQKYYYRYTYAEIGKLNGYTGEYARLKLKKAIKLCKKIVYNNEGTGTTKENVGK